MMLGSLAKQSGYVKPLNPIGIMKRSCGAQKGGIPGDMSATLFCRTRAIPLVSFDHPSSVFQGPSHTAGVASQTAAVASQAAAVASQLADVASPVDVAACQFAVAAPQFACQSAVACIPPVSLFPTLLHID